MKKLLILIKVIEKVINHILINNIKHDISINLSLESINNTAFIAWLEKNCLNIKVLLLNLYLVRLLMLLQKDVDKLKTHL